jgi:hypothetical protein
MDGARTGPTNSPSTFTSIGDLRLLDHDLLALFCSQRCPGNLILATYDLIRALRDRKAAFVGGFQTPMEAECLTLLLRGDQPVVICPNRGIEGMRLPPVWREPVAQGRLLIASPFTSAERRKTRTLGERRNAFVLSLASRVLVTYANPGGSTERACHAAIAAGKPVYTVADQANGQLVAAGAIALPVPELIAELSKPQSTSNP